MIMINNDKLVKDIKLNDDKEVKLVQKKVA